MSLPKLKLLRLAIGLVVVLLWLVPSVEAAEEVAPEWTKVQMLRSGDWLLTDGGWAQIEAVEQVVKSTPVYNLQVSGSRTFWANGILAHNKDDPSAGSNDCSILTSLDSWGAGASVDVTVEQEPKCDDESRCYQDMTVEVRMPDGSTLGRLPFTFDNYDSSTRSVTRTWDGESYINTSGNPATLSPGDYRLYVYSRDDRVYGDDCWACCATCCCASDPTCGDPVSNCCPATSGSCDTIEDRQYDHCCCCRRSFSCSKDITILAGCPDCPVVFEPTSSVCGAGDYELTVFWSDAVGATSYKFWRCIGDTTTCLSWPDNFDELAEIIDPTPDMGDSGPNYSFIDNNDGACYGANAEIHYVVEPRSPGCDRKICETNWTFSTTSCTCNLAIGTPSVPLGDDPIPYEFWLRVFGGDESNVTDISLSPSLPGVISLITQPDETTLIPDPIPDPPYEFFDVYTLQTIGLGTNLVLTATVTTDSGFSCNCSSGTFTVTPIPAWYQAENGDIHAGFGIYDSVPETYYCLLAPTYTGEEEYPGVAFYDSASYTVDFNGSLAGEGRDRSSDEGWIVGQVFPRTDSDSPFAGLNYAYFEGLIGPLVEAQIVDSSISSIGGSLLDSYYEIIDDAVPGIHLNLTGGMNIPSNREMVFLIDGDLTIGANATVGSNASSVVFIVSGDVTIEPSTVPRVLEGIYFVDGSFTSASQVDPAADPATEIPDGQLTANGIFVAQSFSLERNLLEGNNTGPAEKFTFDPEQWFESPDALWYSNFIWQEIAP